LKGPSPGADRILKGDDTAELPRQAPVKCELIIDLKTANAFRAGDGRPRCGLQPTRRSNFRFDI
jgi:hypothetical protein